MADRLTPARRAVLLGLLEGREISRSHGGRTPITSWSTFGRRFGTPMIEALTREGLVRPEQTYPTAQTLRLTPAGRALAERLAKEPGR